MTIKRFGWKDRDTAATDFLQLVYHGPKTIRLTALDILQAIRSEKIVPDLKAIVLDSEWDYWERIYALRAISEVRGDIYLPEFAILVKRDIENWKSSKERTRAVNQDYLVDIRSFVEAHPSNERWFWSELNNFDSFTMINYLNWVLNFGMSTEWTRKLIEHLIKLVEQNSQLINLHSVEQIYRRGNDNDRSWLLGHLELIVEKCLATKWHPENKWESDNVWWLLPDYWPELVEAFKLREPVLVQKLIDEKAEKTANFATQRQERENRYDKYQESPIWKKLQELYERAISGDKDAQALIERTTWRHKLDVSVRAAATYLLGKLQQYPSATRRLRLLLTYDTSMFDNHYQAVRMAAGEALKDNLTPEIWEVFTNAIFISPDNVLSSFMIEWLAYITDVLSGISTPYSGHYFGDDRRWFGPLVDITDSLEDLGLA